MRKRIYSLGLLGGLCLVACRSEEAKPGQDVVQEPMRLTITGDLEFPEWVDLETPEDKARALTLRPNEREYPKIRLSGIEDSGEEYEPFPSHVWNFSKGANIDPYREVRTDVEDSGIPMSQMGTPESLLPNRNDIQVRGDGVTVKKGISRIIKTAEGKYRVLISFNTVGNVGTAYQDGKPREGSAPSSSNYPIDYDKLHSVFVSFNVHRGDVADPIRSENTQSQHRIYMPYVLPIYNERSLQDRDKNNHERLQTLEHTVGDYVVSESGGDHRYNLDTSKPHSNDIPRFKLPLMSLPPLKQEVRKDLGIHAQVQTSFRFGGVLLGLRLDNRTNREIIVKEIVSREAQLWYRGYYEIFRYHNKSKTEPPFWRTNNLFEEKTDLPFWTKVFPVVDTGGAPCHLHAGTISRGRFYLWGTTSGNVYSRLKRDKPTREVETGNPPQYLQVKYAYADSPDEDHLSRVVNIAPQDNKGGFKYGKAYLITVPIREKQAQQP